jgi:hypothetical protein
MRKKNAMEKCDVFKSLFSKKLKVLRWGGGFPFKSRPKVLSFKRKAVGKPGIQIHWRRDFLDSLRLKPSQSGLESKRKALMSIFMIKI